MHKPESVLKNATHKILWDFEKQTHYQIPVRGPNLEIIYKKKKKKTCCIMGFAVQWTSQ